MQGGSATYYEVLGIVPTATPGEVKAAYAKRLDDFRQRLTSQARPSAQALDQLRQAFVVLADPATRQAYDARLEKPAKAAAPTLPPVAAAASARHGGVREETFQFVGEGGEYFRIWIVNLLLSIVTLGIYSAWAKVRREQYFHRNLLLDGSGFDYHGQAKAILKGRIIALGLLASLSVAKNFGATAYGVAILCLLPLVPWLAVKAFRFRAHNTSYRGLRFSFHGTYRQAFTVFVGYGLLAVATLWLAFPLFYRQLRKFVLDNTRFGSTDFACSVGIGAIYRIFLLPGLLFGALFAGLVVLAVSLAGSGQVAGAVAALGFVFALFPVLLILLQAIVVPYVAARTANAVWGSTRLGPHAFVSRLPVGGFIRLSLVNWLAILLTLGLFIPWARVRMARFRAAHLALAVDGDLDDFVAGEASAAPAVGDEAAEMFDLDIGL